MSNGNSLNIIFQYEHVFISNGNVNSWIKKSVVDIKRYHFWYLVVENIRKYFLIILQLCRLNKKFNLHQAYTIKVLKLKAENLKFVDYSILNDLGKFYFNVYDVPTEYCAFAPF